MTFPGSISNGSKSSIDLQIRPCLSWVFSVGNDAGFVRGSIRPFGQISSIGVHTEELKLNGLLCYGKNVTMAFGRCPVRSIFEEALALLVKEQKKVAFLCGQTMSLEDAPQAYKDFEQQKVHKIVFKPHAGKEKLGESVAAKAGASENGPKA